MFEYFKAKKLKKEMKEYTYTLAAYVDSINKRTYITNKSNETYTVVLQECERRFGNIPEIYCMYFFAVVVLRHEINPYKPTLFDLQDEYFKKAFDITCVYTVGQPGLESSFVKGIPGYKLFLDILGKELRDEIYVKKGRGRIWDDAIDRWTFCNDFFFGFLSIYNELYKDMRKPCTYDYFGL